MENCIKETKTCLFEQTFKNKQLLYKIMDRGLDYRLVEEFPEEFQNCVYQVIKIYQALVKGENRYVMVSSELANLIRESEWMMSRGEIDDIELEHFSINNHYYFHVHPYPHPQSAEQDVSS